MIWLNLRAGKMKRILCFVIGYPSGKDEPNFPARDVPLWSRKRKFKASLAKPVWSRRLDFGRSYGPRRKTIQLGQVVKCDALMESGGIKKEEGGGRTGNKFPWPHPTLPLFSPLGLFFTHALILSERLEKA